MADAETQVSDAANEMRIDRSPRPAERPLWQVTVIRAPLQARPVWREDEAAVSDADLPRDLPHDQLAEGEAMPLSQPVLPAPVTPPSEDFVLSMPEPERAQMVAEPDAVVAALAEAASPAAQPVAEVATETEAVAAAEAPASTPAAAPEVKDPAILPLIRTADYAAGAFIPDRRERESAWIAAEGEARAAASIEIARLLMSQMLLPEARSFHERAREEGLMHNPALFARWQAMGHMLDVLQHAAPETPVPEAFEEAGLWRVASGGAFGDGDLSAAVMQLQNHSEPVISALLPRLFDAALRKGDLRIAEGLLRGAREATRLPEQPVYHLMMGQLALAYDMPKDAFDYYARAAEGRDLAAQRARIAMADLALERKDPKLLPALRDILLEGVNQWRHDHEALILRARLAQVAEDLGDIPLALDIMGKIRQDHPGTPEAVLAHERGALALAAFAVAVEAEVVSLESYLITLRDVESFYRLDPVWPIARQALARAFSRAGLHTAAAAEYTALQIDLHRVGAPVPPARQAVEIPLNEAEAWLQAHHIARAQVALARTGLPRFEELQPRYNSASLQAGSVAFAAIPPDFSAGEDPALYARAARLAGYEGLAREAHQAMALSGALEQSPAEALHAVRLAEAEGEAAQAQLYFALAQQTPEGLAFAERPALFAGLTAPMPDLRPLSRELSDGLLARSADAAAAARALLARPILADDYVSLAQPSDAATAAPSEAAAP